MPSKPGVIMYKNLTWENMFLKIITGIFFLLMCLSPHLGMAEKEPTKIRAQYQYEIQGSENNGGDLNQPAGIDLDQYGNLYVADTINSRVVVFDSIGKFKTKFGKYGKGEEDLSAPMALTVNQNKDLVYVADSSNYRVQIFKTDGKFVSTMDLMTNMESLSKKIRPIGIAVNKSGNIYVSDANNHYIHVYAPDGTHLFSFGGLGSADGQISLPVGLSIDKDDKVYVVDMNNARVQIFEQSGKFVSKLGSLGDAKGDLAKPKDIAVDNRGNIFVTDGANLVVQIFDQKGKFLEIIGAEKEVDLQFASPFGLAIDTDHLYITDRWRNSVRVYKIQY